MASIKNIRNPVWALSTIGYGVIVEGIATIRQRIDLAIRTTKGTDPLRPEFGSYVHQFVDIPVNVAVPNIKKEILTALQLWVPEIKVTEIKHSFESPSNPVFEIVYSLVDEDLVDKLLFDLRQGKTVSDSLSEIILQAFFPDNPNHYRYILKLQKNGKQVFPLPNPSGFGTIQELFQWATNNWFFLGRWYLLSDRVVLYMNSDGVKSATLSIEVLAVTQFQSDFPTLNPGEFFKVTFKANGVNAVPPMPQTFNSPGAVLAFAQRFWSSYANWSIEYLQPTGEGVFSDEFSDEFAVSSMGYRLTGVSYINGFVPFLQIEKV